MREIFDENDLCVLLQHRAEVVHHQPIAPRGAGRKEPTVVPPQMAATVGAHANAVLVRMYTVPLIPKVRVGVRVEVWENVRKRFGREGAVEINSYLHSKSQSSATAQSST